jgi:pyruvate,water dikinase
MNFIVPLDQSAIGAVALVGGKGHNLVNLASAGFPVPPGFVVAADAYQQFVGSLK